MPVEKVTGYWSPYEFGQDELKADLEINATDSSGALLSESTRTAFTHSFDDDVTYEIGYSGSTRNQNFTYDTTKNLIRTIKSTIGMEEPTISVETECIN